MVRAAASSGTLYLWGEITYDLARDFSLLYSTVPPNQPITVLVNSEGGDLFSSLVVYHLLRGHPSEVTCRVLGVAASGAALVVQAADVRVMARYATYMVHEPQGEVEAATATRLEEEANLLRRLTDTMVEIYASRARLPKKKLREMVRGREVWMSAAEALRYGFVDRVED